jgi:two-component system sensor kinase FixL
VTLALPDIEPQGVRLSMALDAAADLVLVDRVQIQQVLVNLIRNAAQAMRDLPRRELRIASRLADGVVEISVADTGRGVPEEVADRLFEPFVTTRSDGTGLGLTICNAIIEAHGGTLTYAPAPAGGSIFRFTVTAVADTVP